MTSQHVMVPDAREIKYTKLVQVTDHDPAGPTTR